MKSKLFTLLTAASLTAVAFGAVNDPKPVNLEDKVRHELRMLPYINVFDDLSYSVNNGVVTLYGAVIRPIDSRDAENAVKHIAGVTRVENKIDVLPLSPFDDRIRLQTYRSVYGFGPLQRYALNPQPSIRIVVKNGNVTLAGVVATEADKNLAFIRANSVPGVFSVKNDLRIEQE